jgi:hypothetical protein
MYEQHNLAMVPSGKNGEVHIICSCGKFETIVKSRIEAGTEATKHLGNLGIRPGAKSKELKGNN